MNTDKSLGSKTLLTLVLSLLILAFALAACGGGETQEAYPPGGTGQGGGLETPDISDGLPTADAPLTDTETLETPMVEETEMIDETPVAEETETMEETPVAEGTEVTEGTPQATDTATAEATSETTGEATPIATTDASDEMGSTDMVVLPASELIGASIVQGTMIDESEADTEASETTGTTDTVGTDMQEATGFVTDVLIDETGAIQYVIADVTAFIQTEQFGTPTPDPAAPVTDTIGTGDILDGGTVAIPWSDLQVHTDMALDGDDTALSVDDVALTYSGDTTALTTMPVFDTALLDTGGPVIGENLEDETVEVPAEFDGLWQIGEYDSFVLVTADGEDLGTVEDLLIDLAEGQVVYLVTDIGGFLGIGANTVAIPWENATPLSAETAESDIESGTLSVDVTAESLENSPTLDLSDWNPQVEENWDAEWREFWGNGTTS